MLAVGVSCLALALAEEGLLAATVLAAGEAHLDPALEPCHPNLILLLARLAHMSNWQEQWAT